MVRMFLRDAAGDRRAGRARGNVDRTRGENVHQSPSSECDLGKRVGKGGQHHIAGGKIGELPGSASPG